MLAPEFVMILPAAPGYEHAVQVVCSTYYFFFWCSIQKPTMSKMSPKQNSGAAQAK